MYGYMKLAAKPKRVPSLRRVDSCPIVTVSQLVNTETLSMRYAASLNAVKRTSFK